MPTLVHYRFIEYTCFMSILGLMLRYIRIARLYIHFLNIKSYCILIIMCSYRVSAEDDICCMVYSIKLSVLISLQYTIWIII